MRTLMWVVLAALAGAAPLSVADAPQASATESDTKAAPSEDQKAAKVDPTVTTTGPKGKDAKNEKQAFKPPPGFKPKIHDWGIVYCKKTAVLGSRFPKQVCMSEAELKEFMAVNEAMRRDKDQASRMCVGGDCGGT